MKSNVLEVLAEVARELRWCFLLQLKKIHLDMVTKRAQLVGWGGGSRKASNLLPFWTVDVTRGG